MVKRYELSETQWRRIAALLPGKTSDPGRTGVDNRLSVNGVLWVLRSGARWHDLPERYGKWKTAHKRFTRWAKAGVWESIFAALTSDPDNEISCSIAPWCAPTSRRRPEKRGPKSGSGAFQRWTNHQNPSCR